MRRFKPRRPSPAMCVALLALFVACSGTAIAAGVPVNSVGTLQLKTGAVIAPKIRDGAVTSSKLATNSVSQRAMQAGSVGTLEIQQNSIQAGDLRVGAVTTGTIANGAVSASKIRAGAVGTSRLANGAVTNAKIGTSQVGARALRGFVVRSASVTISGGSPARVVTGTATARCAAGEQAVGIGTIWNGGINDDLNTVFSQFITTSAGVPTGATARGSSAIAGSRRFTVQVACLLP